MAISNISDLARVHGADRGDKVAVDRRRRTITYGELDERSNQVANALAAEGVGPAGPTSRSSTRTARSTSRCSSARRRSNAVIVAVNWRLAPPEVAYIVNDAEAKVLVVGEEFVPCSTRSRAELTTRRRRSS